MNDIIKGQSAAKAQLSADLRRFFGRSALLHGEDLEEYQTLAKGLLGVLQPEDELERLLWKDIVDLSWEIRRITNFKASIMNMSRKTAACQILKSLPEDALGGRSADELAETFLVEQGSVLTILRKYDIRDEDINAIAASLSLQELELFDRQLERARERRSDLAREFEFYRTIRFSRSKKEVPRLDAPAVPALPAPAAA